MSNEKKNLVRLFVYLFVSLFVSYFSSQKLHLFRICKMEVFAPNGVKIYNISAGKTIPEWISEKRKKKLKKREGPEIK